MSFYKLCPKLFKTTFKTKAPKAVKEIVAFAKKNMLTDVFIFIKGC